MKKLVVCEEDNGKKLNRFIMNKIETIDINDIYKLLRKKDIKVNGKRVNKNIELYSGDEVLVYINDTIIEEKHKNSILIETVYEDENIIIINKPSRNKCCK